MPLKLPLEVIIKKYSLQSAGKYIRQFGEFPLILTWQHFYNSDDCDVLQSTLSLNKIFPIFEEYPGGEPTVDYIDNLVSEYKEEYKNGLIDSVIGIVS